MQINDVANFFFRARSTTLSTMLSFLVIASVWLQVQILISAVDTGASTQHQAVKAKADTLSRSEMAVSRVYKIIGSKGCYTGRFYYRIQALNFADMSCHSFCNMYGETVQKNLQNDRSITGRQGTDVHVLSLKKNTCMALSTWSLEITNHAESLLPRADGVSCQRSCTCILRVTVDSIANKTRGNWPKPEDFSSPSPSQCDSRTFGTWLQRFIWDPISPHPDNVQLQETSVDEDPMCAAFVQHYRQTRVKDGVKQFEDLDGTWKAMVQSE